METIIAVIKERIKEKGMTIKSTAEKSGVITFDALSQTLLGNRRLMAVELLGLCKVLGLTFKDFAGYADAAGEA